MKNIQSKTKATKIGKQLGTIYFRPEKVKMTNKVCREKSHCAVCWSNKSRFLKQKIN